MKTIAYYRTRPSEPEASELALRLQRQAVQREVEESGYDLVAEFIEYEGQTVRETYPTFISAVRTASSHSTEGFDVILLIVMQAGISTGEPFDEPVVDNAGGIMRVYLQVPSIPRPAEIVPPAGAPGPLSLYANCRPHQLDTLIYLCNAGPDALTDVVVTTDTVGMNEFFASKGGQELWVDARTCEEHWTMVPPGLGIMVAWLDHWIWDSVSRYRVAYTDRAGRRCTAVAYDVNLTICVLSENPDKVWAAFRRAS